MRKVLSILVAIVLVIGLSACGNTSNNNTKESEKPTSVESENASKPTSKEGLVCDSIEAFDFSDVDDGVIITYFKNYDYVEYDKIIIPETINGKNVVGIGALDETDTYYGKVFSAIFGNCEVVIPKTVTFIGGKSFQDAKGLVKLSGGENCKTIGDSAFLGCENLAEITFIDSVTTIAENAFSFCTAWEANH